MIGASVRDQQDERKRIPASSNSIRNAILLTALIAAFVAAYLLRESLALGHSPESVRLFVADLGWLGPAIYVVLFLFRSVFLLPSVVLLAAGGVCFGLVAGTFLGAAGLTLSALAKFFIAHVLGRDRLIARLPARMRSRMSAIDGKMGTNLLAAVTAYPIGPNELIHVVAILSGMSLLPFLLGVVAGSLIRAGSFSLFGNALVEGRGLVAAIVVITGVAIVPLLFKPFRASFIGK